MIIRSGLIRNRDGVDFDTFTTHWQNIHGPLVKKIVGLRAYRQNHILERIIQSEDAALHRVDGISQLYFDDVDAMNAAMASPEQEACIADLKGFLSDVTLLIQDQGKLRTIGPKSITFSTKLLILLKGKIAFLDALARDVHQAIEASGQAGQMRLNPIIARNVTVDKGISAGAQIVDAVLEIWMSEASTALTLLRGEHASRIVAGFSVREVAIVGGS